MLEYKDNKNILVFNRYIIYINKRKKKGRKKNEKRRTKENQ